MPLDADILVRRTTRFLLWSPRPPAQAPQVVLGMFHAGNPPSVQNIRRLSLLPAANAGGLFEIEAAACGLEDGAIIHYWFEVDDSRSGHQPPDRVIVTDPFACSIDWRVFPPGTMDRTQPAGVVRYLGNGRLAECDPGGEVASFETPDAPDKLPPNIRLVIYELPTAWALSTSRNEPGRATATFVDVAALIDERTGGANFSDLSLLNAGSTYLTDLGVNALELLPPADSFFKREWGYDTSHYLAPDSELGYPEGNFSPTANRDLARLVDACHRKGIRFFIDVVMAFAKEEPCSRIDAQDFCIEFDSAHPPDDVDAWTSGRGADGHHETRNGFGSTLWRYSKPVTAYDPISGETRELFPARQLMLTYLTRWMRDFRVDGVRMDSVENVASWDFVQAFKDRGRQMWRQRWTDAGLDPASGADARFLVVGEELSMPTALLRQSRLDGLWNEDFQGRIRAAILGESTGGDDFEWTVRKAIDCRLGGVFTDGAQAVNYITKHDVEGYRHERLFTALRHMPDEQIEKRIKLAFACLMTAVGIPMLLAGEEFADQHDLFDSDGNVTQRGGKQVDPVNFGRLTAGPGNDKQGDPDAYYGPMRRRIYAYVRRLIKLRTTAPSLWVNDTDFLWSDFSDGKRVIMWRRGGAGAVAPIIVIANFSDFGSAPGADYVVPAWPGPAPADKKWVEVTQDRDVDPAYAGRESIYPWEAKIYTFADA